MSYALVPAVAHFFMLFPLKGFFNFLVYIDSRVIHEQNGVAQTKRLALAFCDTVLSRRGKTSGGRRVIQQGPSTHLRRQKTQSPSSTNRKAVRLELPTRKYVTDKFPVSCRPKEKIPKRRFCCWM